MSSLLPSDRQPSWYDTSFRKLFFDFHSSQHAAGLAAAFDAEAWADRCQEAGAQAVSVFVKCAYGWSFYRKGSVRYVHPKLPDGLDMVEEQVASFHRRGIKTIGYYHTFNSEPIAAAHPEWVRCDAAGSPFEPNSICVQGPLLDEWMLPHLAEAVTLYDLDAMFFDGAYGWGPCHCPACVQRFAAAVGAEVPSGPADPAWEAYVRWALADFRRVRGAICDHLHALRPELPVAFNWVYTMRMPEPVPAYVGNLMLDVPPDDQAFAGSYEARHWALTGVPFDIMNSAFLQWWGDWSCKPAACLKHEVAAAIANGGLTWIGYQMTQAFEVAEPVMEQMGQALHFVAEREPVLEGARPVPCVLVLHSTHSHFADGARMMADEAAMRGAHRLFLESGLPHHFVDEDWLLRHLRETAAAERAPVVVLSDQKRIAPDLASALETYVREGGGLLATCRTGTLDGSYGDTGRFALEGLLGVRLAGMYDQTHSYLSVTDATLEGERLAMPHLIEAPAALVEPMAEDLAVLADLVGIYLREDGKFLLRWSPPGQPTGHPALTFRRYGQGAVAYAAQDLFRGFQAKGEWPLKAIAEALVRRLAPAFPVRVTAPAWLEVALAQQTTGGGYRTIVHLVNYHGNRPFDRANLCIEQTLPVRDVTVELLREAPPGHVTLEPGGETPEWSHHDGRLTVLVPEVQIHTAVVVE